MDEEKKKLLSKLPRDEQKARFKDLRERLGIAEPVSIAGGRQPIESSQEDLEEYEFLMKLLGYK